MSLFCQPNEKFQCFYAAIFIRFLFHSIFSLYNIANKEIKLIMISMKHKPCFLIPLQQSCCREAGPAGSAQPLCVPSYDAGTGSKPEAT